MDQRRIGADCVDPPDSKPLADMLRSGKQIPNGIRDLLAELLDPGEPEYLYLRFELGSTRTQTRLDSLFGKELKIADLYGSAIGEGRSSEEALEVVHKKYSCDESTIFRYVAKWHKLTDRLHGGADKHL